MGPISCSPFTIEVWSCGRYLQANALMQGAWQTLSGDVVQVCNSCTAVVSEVSWLKV
ncbi:hypothetical protein TIFTF001_001129 [Ficus carica]|uniref:Uncharacterized protein n=1 Tax=Ficus carica TaxID=3494 RepID=A0AA87ZEB0_FICCA|nr:hypothetical protein TIFTF001_001129 [Ficus carica]